DSRARAGPRLGEGPRPRPGPLHLRRPRLDAGAGRLVGRAQEVRPLPVGFRSMSSDDSSQSGPPIQLAGSEPWAVTGGERGEHGVLVLHGFTGCPQSMRPLAEAFAAAGYTVELPLLPGHGTTVDDMIATGWDDWSAAAAAAYTHP